MIQVSVIVPNYNHAPFLSRRIETVLQQSFNDFELIILDDCSTDNSREVIEKYRSHPKVSTIVYNEKNGGSTFRQWDKGIQLAKGGWIWIAESDDWCKPDFLAVLMEGISKEKDCVIGFAQTFCMADEKTIKWQSSHSKPEECIGGKQFIEQRLVFGCTIFNASMAIFKRDAALKIPIDYSGYKMAGDWLFWIKLAQQGKVYINGKTLNYFRKTGAGVSALAYQSGENYYEELRVLHCIKRDEIIAREYIDRGIFNKFNNFRRRKCQFSTRQIETIESMFVELYGSKLQFRKMLIRSRLKLVNQKITRRLNSVIKRNF